MRERVNILGVEAKLDQHLGGKPELHQHFGVGTKLHQHFGNGEKFHQHFRDGAKLHQRSGDGVKLHQHFGEEAECSKSQLMLFKSVFERFVVPADWDPDFSRLFILFFTFHVSNFHSID